jgi:hypothetical protein
MEHLKDLSFVSISIGIAFSCWLARVFSTLLTQMGLQVARVS